MLNEKEEIIESTFIHERTNKTVTLIYQHESETNIANKEIALIEFTSDDLLEFDEAIDHKLIPWYSRIRGSHEIIAIWGKLKLNIPIERSRESTQYDIDFVQEALNGCKKSQAELRMHALYFIFDYPQYYDQENIYCSKSYISSKYNKLTKEDEEDLKELQALFDRVIK